MRRDRAAEAAEMVAAFEDRDDAASGVPVCEAANEERELGKIRVGQPKLAERIAEPGIESGGDEHQLRSECFRSRLQPGFKSVDDFIATGTRGKRTIDRCPPPSARPRFVRPPGAGIPWRLVRAEEKHGAVRVKDFLRINLFLENELVNMERLKEILDSYGLSEKWQANESRFNL